VPLESSSWKSAGAQPRCDEAALKTMASKLTKLGLSKVGQVVIIMVLIQNN